MCGWGLRHYVCTRNVQLWISDVLPHYFTNIVAQNAARQRMTKYHPQKSLSNNVRSVVKNLPSSSYKILFFTVMWDLFWMTIWLINLMQNESNSYTMFTWHQYELTQVWLALLRDSEQTFRFGFSLRSEDQKNVLLSCNKYREARGNWGELVSEWKAYNELLSCKYPLRLNLPQSHLFECTCSKQIL